MFGYIAAALIGISLGLIGGGGSILTLPVLVYLFGVPPVLATSYSLFIVGVTSVVGAFINGLKGQISIKTALIFGISSIITVITIRTYLIRLLPEHLGSFAGREITTSLLTMLLFAVLMIVAATSMIGSSGNAEMQTDPTRKVNILKLLLYGVGIGAVTGLLGAGGGFLLIPVLVILLHQPMKIAIGTSLMIIAMNSLLGFVGDLNHFEMDWKLLLTISAIAASGMFLGVVFSQRINGNKLKKGFGWFVLAMGTYIVVNEIFF